MMGDLALGSSLIITLIGMTVVFVAMSLFYSSMHILTALTRERPKELPIEMGRDTAVESLQELVAASKKNDLRAAAISVAMARAEYDETIDSGAAFDYAPFSPWGDFYRQRQLAGARGRIAP